MANHPCVETESHRCTIREGIEIRINGIAPIAMVIVVSLVGVYRLSSGLERTVYAAQQIVAPSMRRSPIQLWELIAKASPSPTMISIMPINEIMTLCQILDVVFSTPKIELSRPTNIGTVPYSMAEFPAVVRKIP